MHLFETHAYQVIVFAKFAKHTRIWTKVYIINSSQNNPLNIYS